MAEAFLQLVLDKLISLINREIGLILGVDEVMKKQYSTLTTIQAVLEDAEDKQIKSKPIRNWLQKLNDVAYVIDDVLDECNTHVSKLNHSDSKHSRYSLNKILYRHNIARRMKQVNEKLEAIAAERTKFHLREMSVDKPREVTLASRETASLLNKSNQIHGREEDKDKIVEILVNDVKEKQEMSVLPIIGVGGLGKTTLAQLVFNDPQVEDHFDIRIWVCVSDNFEMKTLVKAMIESATGSGKAWDLQHLDATERRLWELLSKKRYLIVMDDVWNDHQDKWFELRDILSCGSAGSSVVVTTRQKKVADIMTTLPCHCLEGLSDEHCWALLQQRAFGPNEEVSPQMEIIGKQIVNKCAGVPMAATALGGILRIKRRDEEWIHVRDNEIWKLSGEESLIMPALRLSYHHLSLELRQCFAYFAAFPKDHYIEREELVLLWKAHGYISSNGTLQVEDVGNQICNELLLRSLLQTNLLYTNKIGMHDLVHDLAESIMENKVPGVQSERNLASASTVREVNLLHKTALFPKTFQQDMNITSILELKSLRVLYAKAIKYLPPSIINLKHLRYLNLSHSEIRTLPNSLCTLWNLQNLNLDYCDRLVALPKKLTSLRNLQHLCLLGCKSLREMPSKMRNLNGLKTLSMFVVGLKRYNQLEELECLNISGRLEIRHLERVKDHIDAKKAKIAEKNNLRELSLSWERNDLSKLEEEVDERVLEALEPHHNLYSLSIKGFNGRYLPRWMESSTLRKIVEIYITDCENIRRFPKLGELPHLVGLYLTNVKVEYIIEEEDVGNGHPVKIQFVALRSLYLIDLPNLKGLSKKQVSSKEAFPNLQILWIKHCSSLILPTLSSFQNLESLSCSSSTLGLLSEEDIPINLEVDIEESLTCFPIETMSKFRKLRLLTITGAKEISVTREGLQDLKELSYLSLESCLTMRCLPEGMLLHLTALDSLLICDCRELVELPEDIKHLHNLDWLLLHCLPKMTRLPQAFQQLTSLNLMDLPELESLPDQVPSLINLTVADCPKLLSIPDLPKLKEITITGCPQLERRCRRGSGEDWHKIAHVRHINISPKYVKQI
ncbi:disease resistance protein RGA2-like [Salvia hispanica]|uniref:disease resistance protein RGA2-like n=1 Tax=Salvia hispanica TaxID=49212 RepID=UPI002009CD2C|nr:disease resistance protein RGA2-like [Salvia hispanica]XP_047966846.1 disease resistance protein RGA2-like [Salvia hispanica]XP_047966854.1 disease resistance protein RGA2-like [Salvia hispanica]